MLRRTLQSLLIIFAAMAIVVACSRKEKGPPTSVETHTIAPAAGKPSPTDTDAMTQTVDIEDSRSEAEGGAITSPNPPVRTATTGTAQKKTTRPKSRPAGRSN